MTGQSLNDGRAKLVRYTILTIKRGEERILKDGQGQEVVVDSMTSRDFAAWRIARYVQQRDHEEVAEGDKKYLRVFFQVQDRWSREDLRHKTRQLEALGEIRRALEQRASRGPGAASYAPAAVGPAGRLELSADNPRAAPQQTRKRRPSPASRKASVASPNRGRESQASGADAPEAAKSGGLQERLLAALEHLGGSGQVGELVERTGEGRRNLIREALNALAAAGRVERSGTGLRTVYRLRGK